LIKREARLLGLAAHKRRRKQIQAIGVVYRGNLWLDSVIASQFSPNQPEYLHGLIEAIIRSKQYSQIQAVILAREDLVAGIRIDISDFSRKISLPVICLIGRTAYRKIPGHSLKQFSQAERFDLKIAGKVVRVGVVGLKREEAQEIFEVACANGQSIPEAVRVAEIIASHSKWQPLPRTETSPAN
jgi:endonuclease V-like protein UPF0215 family